MSLSWLRFLADPLSDRVGCSEVYCEAGVLSLAEALEGKLDLSGTKSYHSAVCTGLTQLPLPHLCLPSLSRWLESDDKPSPLFPLPPQEEIHNNVEVVHTYRQHILNDMNPSNLHLFISAYNR